MRTFLLQIVHCGIWCWCIVGVLQQVYCDATFKLRIRNAKCIYFNQDDQLTLFQIQGTKVNMQSVHYHPELYDVIIIIKF